MEIEQVVPEVQLIPLEDLTARLAAARPSEPFNAESMEVCAALSRAIFEDPEARGHPELQALAFWMRKSELARMRDAFGALNSEETILEPRGIVFHIPPANVDTIFVYSWLLSALTGNVNVIRLSERPVPAVDILCRLMRTVLKGRSHAVREATTVVRYGHESEITAALSSISDVRVVWGGDATVSRIRQIPLPPHGKELTFPDRKSLSILQAGRYLELSEEEAQHLAERFFNDAFWFDQMACSSPRLIVWCGPEESAKRSSKLFLERLARQVARKDYALPDAARLAQFTFACRAVLEAPVSRYEQNGGVTVLELRKLGQLPSDHCGGGLFFQARIDSLQEFVPLLGRRDQTLAHFGFTSAELRAFAGALCGRAIDRMVPIGQALQFHRFWDGYDLLREFTRVLYLESSSAMPVGQD